MKEKDFATMQIHGGSIEQENIRPLVSPIYQSATFYFDSVEQGAAMIAGVVNGY